MNNHSHTIYIIICLALVSFTSCSKRTIAPQESYEKEVPQSKNLESIDGTVKYLALGDSYTIGTSVPLDSNFPSQLSTILKNQLNAEVETEIIATSGWRTDNLLDALDYTDTTPPYDLVTLLIGVNNQYQGERFSKYKKEFSELFERSLILANENTERLVIISIPDWGYTPFGQAWDMQKISKEIDEYNAYAQEVADKHGVKFINITDITRRGLEDEDLVASDKLHPSAKAYKLFVERMAPIIISQLKN